MVRSFGESDSAEMPNPPISFEMLKVLEISAFLLGCAAVLVGLLFWWMMGRGR